MLVQVAMEMTLDEWKAMQEMSRPKAEFNIRKAEDKIPSKAKVIHESKHVEVRLGDKLWRPRGGFIFFFAFSFSQSKGKSLGCFMQHRCKVGHWGLLRRLNHQLIGF